VNIIIDMGTSNLRIYAEENGKMLASRKLALGSKYAMLLPKNELYGKINGEIADLVKDSTVQGVYVFGMGGSEYGIYETDRISMPIDANTLAANLNEVRIDALWKSPIYIVPGVFYQNERKKEIMRGEETETVGFIAQGNRDCVLILPGSHCKNVRIRNGQAVDFCSTLSGEMLQALAENTILKASVRLDAEINKAYLIKGAECTKKNGINAALLCVRTMECEGYKTDELTSFFIGAVLYNDIIYNLRFAENDAIYVGGKASLKTIYAFMLEFYGENRIVEIKDGEDLGFNGVCEVIRARSEQKEKQAIIEEIKEEKIITIIRGLKKEEYLPTLHALYKGGIRFVEVTFDASGKQSDEETADIIRMLAREFDGKMRIGAGSVLKPSQVRLTKEAGGKYIISPNFDESVVAETNKQSLVSIPGCFTPSEATRAYNFGADFIKIFPNDLGKEKYIKAITAPLPHIPFLAVGGVSENNLADMLSCGARGVGIGSLLIDKPLIREGKFDIITARAEKCVEIVKG